MHGKLLPRVLVVDDYPDTADTLAVFLRLSGYEVEIARDGPSAVTAAQSFRPEVVILDIGLPGLDGWQVAQRIRDQDGSDAPRLVVLTGRGLDDDFGRSFEVGCDVHLVKPFDPTELVRLLKSFRKQPA